MLDNSVVALKRKEEENGHACPNDETPKHKEEEQQGELRVVTQVYDYHGLKMIQPLTVIIDKETGEIAGIFCVGWTDNPILNIRVNDKLEIIKEGEIMEKGMAVKDPIVMPAVTPDEAVSKWKEYQALKEKIVDREQDIQVIQNKSFLKKSYWRKLATFFNLSVEIVEEKTENISLHGKEVLVYHFRARATHNNGRFAEGTGSCDMYDHATIKDNNFLVYDKYNKVWKEAAPKSIHNARTTAETRAWNRAVSNLVGGGEVSAEEVVDTGNGHSEEPAKTTPIKSTVSTSDKQKQAELYQLLIELNNGDETESEIKRLLKEFTSFQGDKGEVSCDSFKKLKGKWLDSTIGKVKKAIGENTPSEEAY